MRCLCSDQVKLRAGPLSDSKAKGRLTWWKRRHRAPTQAPNNISITIDIHQDGAIRLVVHELVHFHLYEELTRWGNLEETIVLGLENDLTELIESDPAQLMRWRLAIQKKLAAHA